MKPMAVMQVEDITIGDGHEVVFIAEIGANYEQDIEVAKLLLQKAKDAGAKLAKMECFRTEDVYRLKAMEGVNYSYATAHGECTEDWISHVAPKSMSMDEYAEIISYSISIGLPIFASVYDMEMMEKMVDLDVCAVKIASCNVVNLALIEHAGKLKIPVFMDTNHSLLDHIARAVLTARKAGVENFLLMHNPIGKRPTPPEKHNFLVMKSYHDIFNVPIGFSCHYRGEEMMYAAIALGTHAIEKPVSRDPDIADSDYVFSLQVDDLAEVVTRCVNVWKSRGKGLLEPCDVPEYHTERLSPCARRKISKGETLSLVNVTFKRPSGSITADYWRQMEGKTVRMDIEPDELIQWGHLEIDPEER